MWVKVLTQVLLAVFGKLTERIFAWNDERIAKKKTSNTVEDANANPDRVEAAGDIDDLFTKK